MQTTFDAVILAGYDPNRSDPLTLATGQPHKALILLGGQPLVWHVVNALSQSKRVERVLIVGLEPEAGINFSRPVEYLPQQENMLDNVRYALNRLAEASSPSRHALVLMSDAPLLTGAMIDWFLAACPPLEKELYWGVVERAIMEKTFPASKRSYLRTVEGQFSSGDIYMVQVEMALRQHAVIQAAIGKRKSVFAQLRLLGPGVIFKFLLRRLRLHELVAVGERVMGLTAAPVILPFAEPGMDVDKPFQLEQVQEYWQRMHSGQTK